MNKRLIVLGVDPAPTCLHTCRVSFEVDSDHPEDEPTVVWAYSKTEPDPGISLVSTPEFVAVEDPRGVLFSRTSSKLWSETCAMAGGTFWKHYPRSSWVSPQAARASLAEAAGQMGLPRKDSEVRQLLEVIYGKDAFAKEKLCRKRKNKTHGNDCPLCFGTTVERYAGKLAELSTAHYRDAFVAARHLAKELFKLGAGRP